MSDQFDFDYDEEAAASTRGALDASKFVKLPFETVIAKWKRGEPGFDPKIGSGIKFYGGWKIDGESLRKIAPEIPERYQIEEYPKADQSGTYPAYCVRSMPVVPIARRDRWIEKIGKSQVHYLAYTAIFNATDKTYRRWLPMILSATSNAGLALDDAFNAFAQKTAKLRHEIAHDAPANFFWCHLGTFGDQRFVKEVGSGQTKNYITPPLVYVPEEPDKLKEYLKQAFVGKEMTVLIGQMVEEAREWLADWKKPTKKPEAPQPEAPAAPRQAPNLNGLPF